MAVVKSTLKNMLKVTKAQYNTLINGGTITDGTETYTYDANAIYLIDDGIDHNKIYLVDVAPSSDDNGIVLNFGDVNEDNQYGLSYAYIGEIDSDALTYHADSHRFEGSVTFVNTVTFNAQEVWLTRNTIYHKFMNQTINNTFPSSSGVLALQSEIPTKLSQLTNDYGYITGIGYNDVINALGYTPGTSSFSGSYNDLTDKPTIPVVPTNVSAFTNDAGYLTSADMSNYQPVNNLLTSISGLATNVSGLLKFTNGVASYDMKAYCSELYVDTSARQPLAIIGTPLININGKSLTNYTSTEIPVGAYTATQILTSGGVVLTEQQAKNYMYAQGGSYYLPTYNYDNPKNVFFISSDFTVYKPQYDTTNGLLLYKMGQIVSDTYLKSNFSASTTQTITFDVYTGSWGGTQTQLTFTKRYIGNGLYLYTYISSSTTSNSDYRYNYAGVGMTILAYGAGDSLSTTPIPVTGYNTCAHISLTSSYLYVHYAMSFWFIADK